MYVGMYIWIKLVEFKGRVVRQGPVNKIDSSL
jgi:hypothetical protein